MTLRPLSTSRRALLEKSTARYQGQLDQAAHAYLDARGLGSSRCIETLRFGVVRAPLKGHELYVGRLVIPYIGPGGNVYHLRFRCIEHGDCKSVGCSKYLGLPGEQSRIYNTRALTASTRSLIITEGELDAATVNMCGWPAIGVAGSDSWHAHYPRVVAGFESIVILADGDKPGQAFAKKVAATLPQDYRIILFPPGEDVNSIYVAEGKRGLEEMFSERDEDE